VKERTALQNNDSYIGQLLVTEGVIKQDDLARGLEEQKARHEFLCATLVRLGLAREEKVFSILSLQIGVPFLNLKEAPVDTSATQRMPGKLARACRCFLLRICDDVAFLATSDPLNTRAIEEVRTYLGVSRVKTFLAGDQDLAGALQKYYAASA
jgi:MSHA biogenesis protein MshE